MRVKIIYAKNIMILLLNIVKLVKRIYALKCENNHKAREDFELGKILIDED